MLHPNPLSYRHCHPNGPLFLKSEPRSYYFFSTIIMPWPTTRCTKNLTATPCPICGVNGLQNERHMRKRKNTLANHVMPCTQVDTH